MSTLVLTAHGSRDPRSGANARALADRLTLMRPDLDVRLAFLELNEPNFTDVLAELPDSRRAVVAPLLLASAYHARLDIPKQIARAGARGIRQADVLGEDDRLVSVLRERLAELTVSPLDDHLGVMVVAIGSSNLAANARTARVAAKLASGTRWPARRPPSPPGASNRWPVPPAICAAKAPPARHRAVVFGAGAPHRQGLDLRPRQRHSDGGAAGRPPARRRGRARPLRAGVGRAAGRLSLSPNVDLLRA